MDESRAREGGRRRRRGDP